MSTTLPSSMKALIVQADKTATFQDHPVPTIADDEVLVKTVAVALGPPDLISLAYPKPGTILGLDWAGEVVQVGGNVTSRQIGERVAGFVHGGSSDDVGAFAEYVKSPADLVWHIPESLSYDEAAAMSIGLCTCAQALYHKGRLELPLPGDKAVGRGEWFFVYGGSSSCGQYTIQLARASGFNVATTSSPRNFELLKSLGAAAVFDYHDPEIVQKVKQVTRGSIRYGLDAIGSRATQELSQLVFGPAGGKLLTLMPVVPEAKVRDDVNVTFTLVHTGLRQPLNLPHYVPGVHYPASSDDNAEMVAFIATIPRLIKQGRLVPNPLKPWDGGLATLPQGLKYLQEGKVSGEKIVVRI
ncbi:GroES-like protein [Trametes meyenii]|nr:GroES-like protein [Trametes meyenii]